MKSILTQQLFLQALLKDNKSNAGTSSKIGKQLWRVRRSTSASSASKMLRMRTRATASILMEMIQSSCAETQNQERSKLMLMQG
jgi:hypothetical protein